MKYYISYLCEPYASIKSNTESLRSGDFKYPIISCMNNGEEHNTVISIGNDNMSDFKGLRDDVLKSGVKSAGFVNIVLGGDFKYQIEGLYNYLINKGITNGDKIIIDLTGANRYIKFSLLFTVKYLNDTENIDYQITSIKDDSNEIIDITNKYQNMSLIEIVSNLLKITGII